jgi:hypothetical protein
MNAAAVGVFSLSVSASGELQILSGVPSGDKLLAGREPKKLASGPPGSYLIMQNDGDLAFYPPGFGAGSGRALWESRTWGHPGAVAMLSNWGDIFIVDPKTGVVLGDSGGESVGLTLGNAGEIEINP